MPISFNFNAKFTIPRVVSQIYEYAPIEPLYTVGMSDGQQITINVKDQVDKAWQYLEKNCAKSDACNTYFKNLSRAKSLAEWMQGTEFVVHLLRPKKNSRSGKVYGEGDLPQANSAGSDIGISMYTFIEKKGNDASFAAVLLHEIAHRGGATTNPSGKQALEAENALIPCGLKQHFLDSAKG